MAKYFKLARLDGFDFHTGNTINYRDSIGQTVKSPNYRPDGALLCSDAVLHASDDPNKCFLGKTKIPCSAYIVEGNSIVGDDEKCGFAELFVVEEVTDLDKMFGWTYSEAIDPINALLVAERMPLAEAVELLKIRASIRDSIKDSVWASIKDSVGTSVGTTVWASIMTSIWDSVGASVWASIKTSVWAYTGSLFPNIEEWYHMECKVGAYPYKASSDLWRSGYVPSYDGKTWRLHAGATARVVYTEEGGS